MKCDVSMVGEWYLRRDLGEMFQVTGYDERSSTIEIQNFDGSLDEIEEETWRELALRPAEPPKDWTGPLDNVETDDADDSVQPSEGYELIGINVDPGYWPDLEDEEELDSVSELVEPEAALATRIPHSPGRRAHISI